MLIQSTIVQHIITVKIKLSLLFCGILIFLLFSFVFFSLLPFVFSVRFLAVSFFFFSFLCLKTLPNSNCKSPLYRKFFVFVSTFFHFVEMSFDTSFTLLSVSSFRSFFFLFWLLFCLFCAWKCMKKRMCLGTFSRRGAVASATIYSCAECASCGAFFVW